MKIWKKLENLKKVEHVGKSCLRRFVAPYGLEVSRKMREPEDDIVHEHLTVREQIHFSAQLRNEAAGGEMSVTFASTRRVLSLRIQHVK